MRTVIRSLVFFVALGAIVGFVIGLVKAAIFVQHNQYLHHGMHWLATDALTRELSAWLVRGAITGLIAGAVVAVIRAVAAVPIRHMQGVRAELSGRQRAALDALLAAVALVAPLLIVGLLVFNHKFILYPYTRRYWMLNAGLIGGSGALLWLLWAIFLRVRQDVMPSRVYRAVVGAALSCAGVAVAGYLLSLAVSPSPPADTPSIFLLTVDTLRADRLGAYGYPKPTSPRLDALFEEGHLFLRAYSHAPATSSSFASIMSGLVPRETGTYSNDALQLRMNTLAEQLRNAGYRTGAVVSNLVLRRGQNYEHGFDFYDANMDEIELVRESPERIATNTTKTALRWLQEQANGTPVFLWVHYIDPHGPYTAPEPYAGMFDDVPEGPRLPVNDSVGGQGGIPSYQVLGEHRNAGYYEAQYDAEIRYFDDAFHELVEGIRTLGRWEDSLVLFTADHGESMGEYDYYFAHAQFLYPNQIHVPLAVWGPEELVAAGARDSTVVQLIDVAPTVLDFAGIRSRQELPGRVLYADGLEDAEVFSETVYHDNYKCSLLVGPRQIYYDHLNGDYRLMDLATGDFVDPPPDDDGYWAAVEELGGLRNLDYEPERSSGKASPDLTEKLKALGYTH